MSDLKVRPPKEESRSLASLGMTGGEVVETAGTQAGVPVPHKRDYSEGGKGAVPEGASDFAKGYGGF